MPAATSQLLKTKKLLFRFSIAFASCLLISPATAKGRIIQLTEFNSAEIAYKIELPASFVEAYDNFSFARTIGRSNTDSNRSINATAGSTSDAAGQPNSAPKPATPLSSAETERRLAKTNRDSTEKTSRKPPTLKPAARRLIKEGSLFDSAKLNASESKASNSPEPNSITSNSITSNPSLYFGRESLAIKSAIEPIAKKLAPCVVKIFNDFDHVTLGTVVSSNGLIIAKHSELSKTFQCLCSNGIRYKGRLIGIHPQNDLALIQIKATDLTPIRFSNSQSATAGGLVVSVGPDGTPIGFGLISVQPQSFGIKQPECKDCIDFGATVSQYPVIQQTNSSMSANAWQQAGLQVKRVYPRSASESTGLLVGDLMQTINGTSLASRSQLDEIGKTLKIGQTLRIQVLRNGKPVQLSTEIKNFAPRTLHDRWGGGPFSTRRFGFGKVIAHDSVIAPENCGSPLVGLDGQVVGINIARSMRVATFAVPIASIHRFIKYVRPNSQLDEAPKRN